MLKRPSKDDTEEDLLRFQEEFLTSKSAPAVTLIKANDKKKAAEKATKDFHKDVVQLTDPSGNAGGMSVVPPEKKVRFNKQTTSEDVDAEELLDRHDSHITKVLSDIVEHDFKSPPVYFPEAPVHGGFPKVIHRGATLQNKPVKSQKKKSLFAQQFLKGKSEEFGVSSKRKCFPTEYTFTGHVVEKNVGKTVGDTRLNAQGVVTGEGLTRKSSSEEAKAIHDENLTTLSGMTDEEILREQSKLLEMLDPSLVNFLKMKKSVQKPTDTKQEENMDSSTDTSHSLIVEDQAVQDQVEKHLHEKEDKIPHKADLPVQPSKDWVNMSDIEYDKMEWMTTLPIPKPGDSGTGHTARFDFQGCLIAADADIPVHLGLHHHGKEPEKAGYTLEEIFQLCRSANMQQRVMALHILANIISNARNGYFSGSTSTYIIPALLDGGLIFMLRWALDDHTDNTMAAAVNLLHVLLVCQADESALDLTFHWFHGHQVCSLSYKDPEEEMATRTNDSDVSQETDADVVKKDVVQGLLRMSLLPRLRFILHKWQPAASTVIQILEILTRLARHSSQVSYQISQCSGLLETIFDNFLPCHWTPVTDYNAPLVNVYGYPVPQALKLMRVLCSAGRNMTACTLSSYGLMQSVTRYMCDEVDSLQLHPKEAQSLVVEAYRTWQVCCSYGLAVLYYENMYPMIIKKLQSFHSVTTEVSKEELRTSGTSLITVLESIVQVASSVTFINTKQKETQSSYNEEKNTMQALPPINWSQIQGLFQPVASYMQNELENFTAIYFDKPYNLSYLSALINFVATYFGQIESQPGYSAVDTLTQMEVMCDSYLIPCVKSHAFTLVLRNLRQNSVLLHQTQAKRGEVVQNLPELGALCGDNAERCPVLSDKTTVHFLIAFTRLLLSIGRLHKGLATKLFPFMIQHEEVLQYIRKLCLWQKKAPLAANYFSKFENILQFNLITMSRLLSTRNNKDEKLCHLMSLYLLIHLQQGDEYIAHSLLSMVTFNQDFLTDVFCENAATSFEESVKLEEEKYLTSATTEVIKMAHIDLMKDSCDNLPAIRNCYLQAVAGLISALQKSRNQYLPNPLDISKLQAGDIGQLLVPLDWPFLPLVELYNNSVNRHEADKEYSKNVESFVMNTLRWVYVIECWRPGILDSVSLTLKLTRLLCVFLSGNDLFLNANIHGYLLSLLKIYCKPAQIDRINLEEKVPGLASFYDLYTLLLNHFEAVSFGDALFAGYILLPLQQMHDIKYRKAVWSEHIGVIQTLTMPLNQVIIQIKRFLSPEETNLELLRLYFQGLYSGNVNPNRNPLPYLIAVHHVNRFLYTQDGKNKNLKDAFIKQADNCKNKTLRQHLFYYKMYDSDAAMGINLYEELPVNRKALLKLFNIDN